jgi:predicted DNA-binding transcriptional regulator AlpA
MHLTARQVRERYGNASDMWLWRRLHDKSGFPQPLRIGRRRFWLLAALEAWERSCAAKLGEAT